MNNTKRKDQLKEYKKSLSTHKEIEKHLIEKDKIYLEMLNALKDTQEGKLDEKGRILLEEQVNAIDISEKLVASMDEISNKIDNILDEKNETTFQTLDNEINSLGRELLEIMKITNLDISRIGQIYFIKETEKIIKNIIKSKETLSTIESNHLNGSGITIEKVDININFVT